jgi:transcriptional regulator with PAS, ATPase and Fis domain
MQFFEFILEVLNSDVMTSVAASAITVLFGGYLAIYQYKHQKKIEREEEIKKQLIGYVTKIQSKIHTAILIIDRIANTYQWSQKDQSDVKLTAESIEHEASKISQIINEDVPYLRLHLLNEAEVFYGKTSPVKEKLENFKTRLKECHDPIANVEISLKQRAEEQDKLKTDDFDESVKSLVSEIWNSNTNSND